MLRPALAAVLGAASLAMLVHFVANPLYDEWVDVGAVWDAFSYVLAVGYLLALGVTYRLKAESEASRSGSAESVLLTIAFYATVFLTIVFFRNWTSSSCTWSRTRPPGASGGWPWTRTSSSLPGTSPSASGAKAPEGARREQIPLAWTNV